MEQIKVFLNESDIPRQWYNLAADLPTPMLPPLGPDGKPVSPDMLTGQYTLKSTSVLLLKYISRTKAQARLEVISQIPQ